MKERKKKRKEERKKERKKESKKDKKEDRKEYEQCSIPCLLFIKNLIGGPLKRSWEAIWMTTATMAPLNATPASMTILTRTSFAGSRRRRGKRRRNLL